MLLILLHNLISLGNKIKILNFLELAKANSIFDNLNYLNLNL